MNIKRNILFVMLLVAFTGAWAQKPYDRATYYSSATGTSGAALKTALCAIIEDHTTLSYGSLNSHYADTDLRPDGKLWDMYSDMTNYTLDDAGSGTEGAGYNKEHSLPKSWFGGASPMYSDIVHVIPADSWVNSMRSNLPFGETSNPEKWSNNKFSKKGPCDSSIGYSGTVFEPNDEYKGDFARIYFYMVTCYENKIKTSSWSGGMFQSGTYPAFQEWALRMLLRWAQEDPVSQKEIDRNNGVWKVQGNRNPYVDYPGLEQYVWGDMTDVAFDAANYSGTEVETVSTPIITPNSGTYFGEQTVSISCSTEGATIHYTTDGSMPTAESTLYSAPFVVSSTTTVKAIAVLDEASSRVASVVLQIKDSGGEIAEGTIWSEDFAGYAEGTDVADVQNPAAIYSSGDNGQYTKIYNASNAGGEAPELLVPKSDRYSYFQAVVSLNGASGQLTLTFHANNKNIRLTTTTTGVTIGSFTYDTDNKYYTFPINVAEGVSTMTLKFENTTKSNTRVDDFLLTAPTEQELLPVILAFDPTEVSAVMGEAFTEPTLVITPSDAQIAVTYRSDNTDVATVNATTGKVTLVGTGAANIIASFEGDDTYMEAEDAAYLLTVSEGQEPPIIGGEGIYAKIESTDELESGKNYLLVYEPKTKAYAGFDGESWGLSTDVTIDQSTIDMTDEANADAHVLMLEQTADGAWTIKDGNVYLALTSNKNTLTTQTSATATGTKWTISFTDGQARINNVEHSNYYLQFNDASNQLKFRCYGDTQKNAMLYKEQEPEPVEVTIGSTGYATLYYGDRNLVVPADMTATTYSVNDGQLTTTKQYTADEVIPAATGVVLHAPQGTYSFAVSSTEGTAPESNMLRGSDEDATTTGEADGDYKFYILSLNAANEPESIGFYYKVADGGAFTNGAHKAYLAVPAEVALGANAFMLDPTQTTGIKEMENPSPIAGGAIYTISGQRVTGSHLPKGIYIQNGKKRVIR